MQVQQKTWLDEGGSSRLRLSSLAHDELVNVMKEHEGKALRIRIAGFG
jgi:hypothetical protein